MLRRGFWIFPRLGFGGISLYLALSATPAAGDVRPWPPQKLSDTGLYRDPVTRTIAAEARVYSPQYPLWTDGATKLRWVALPKGSAIDAKDAEAWRFPVGTRFWKQFS